MFLSTATWNPLTGCMVPAFTTRSRTEQEVFEAGPMMALARSVALVPVSAAMRSASVGGIGAFATSAQPAGRANIDAAGLAEAPLFHLTLAISGRAFAWTVHLPQ